MPTVIKIVLFLGAVAALVLTVGCAMVAEERIAREKTLARAHLPYSRKPAGVAGLWTAGLGLLALTLAYLAGSL